jgi:hypothetical protein
MISFRCSVKSGLSETGAGIVPVAIAQMTSPARVLPDDIPSPCELNAIPGAISSARRFAASSVP